MNHGEQPFTERVIRATAMLYRVYSTMSCLSSVRLFDCLSLIYCG